MTTSLDNLIRLAKSQIKPASKVLARAFQDDPLWAYFIPDGLMRKSKLHYISDFLVRYGVLYCQSYATSGLEGVALWVSPEQGELTLWRMIRCGALTLYFNVGRKIVSRMNSFFDYSGKVHHRLAPFPHWYLGLIGVDPEFQGRGYASALIKPMLAQIDKEHLPCYLETANEKNVPVYEHYGFEVVESGTIPSSSVNYWAMLRAKRC
jgi:ribosomal protein S18 acetylase RimI-like enzyme